MTSTLSLRNSLPPPSPGVFTVNRDSYIVNVMRMNGFECSSLNRTTRRPLQTQNIAEMKGD